MTSRGPAGRSSIVVTGVGISGALGQCTDEAWDRLLDEDSAVETRSDEWSAVYGDCPVAMDDINRRYARPSEACSTPESPSVVMALLAAGESIRQSGIDKQPRCEPYEIATIVGSCQGQIGAILGADGYEVGRFEGSKVPHFALDLVHRVADENGFLGPRVAVNTACASGAHAIVLAAEWLVSGRISVAVVGGVDELNPLAFCAFQQAGAIDKRGCLPYGRSAGLSMGEGAGFLVLESSAHALGRGANRLAELRGWACSSDAYHPTAPDPDACAAEMAVSRALNRSELEYEDLDYICGHGTGTAANDSMEARLFERINDRAKRRIPTSSIKGATGHAFGGSAAMEAVVCILAIERRTIPPNRSYEMGCPTLDVVSSARTNSTVDAALSNSHAFGGSNASLVFGRVRTGDVDAIGSRRHGVALSGIGIACMRAATVDADLIDPSRSNPTITAGGHAGKIAPAYGVDSLGDPPFVPRRQWRRFDQLTRAAVSSVAFCLDDAQRWDLAGSPEVALVVATAHGPLDTCLLLAEQSQGGKGRIDPVVFANSAVNAAAGHVCTAFQWKGPSITILAGDVSAVGGILFAQDLLTSGEVQAALVVSGDVGTPERLVSQDARSVCNAIDDPGSYGFRQDRGGVVGCLLLERPESLLGGSSSRAYCEIAGGAQSSCAQYDDTSRIQSLRWCLQAVMSDATWDRDEVGTVFSAIAGDPAMDVVEAEVILEIFGRDDTLVTAPRLGRIGNGAADGVLGLSAASAWLSGHKSALPVLDVAALVQHRDYRWASPASLDHREYAILNTSCNGSMFSSIALTKPNGE